MRANGIIYVNKRYGTGVRHSHNSTEFIYCADGEGTLYIEGSEPIPFKKGMLIRVMKGAVHYDTSDVPYRQIAFQVGDADAELSEGEAVVYDNDGSIEALLKLIFNAYHGKKDKGGELIYSLLDIWLKLYLGKSGIPQRPNSAVESAKRIIAERFTDSEFLLSDITKDIPYSEAHLRKLFRESIGLSMQDYLNALRLDYSKTLLSSEGISVAMAAEMSGFSDPRYFSRLFKSRIGLTPTEYKKKGK